MADSEISICLWQVLCQIPQCLKGTLWLKHPYPLPSVDIVPAVNANWGMTLQCLDDC